MVLHSVIVTLICGFINIASTNVKAKDDPIIAIVNGTEILFSHVLAAQKRLPQDFQSIPIEEILPRLVNNLIDTNLAAANARLKEIDKTNEYNTQIDWIKKQVLQQLLFSKIMEKAITNDALRTLYEKESKKFLASEQIQASHILLKTKKEAEEVIALLEKGSDFAELAKKKSTGPSAVDGGDLGFFGRGQMVPEFEIAAYKLRPEAYTKKPVKTQFGWHVIKAGLRKSSKAPSFELLEPKLRNMIFQEKITEFIKDLRKDAKIELFNLDGTSRKLIRNLN